MHHGTSAFVPRVFSVAVAVLVVVPLACHHAAMATGEQTSEVISAKVPDSLRSAVRPDSECMNMDMKYGPVGRRLLRAHSCAYTQGDTTYEVGYDALGRLVYVSRRWLVSAEVADSVARAVAADIDAGRPGGRACADAKIEGSEIKRYWTAPPDILLLSVDEPVFVLRDKVHVPSRMASIWLTDMLSAPKCS